MFKQLILVFSIALLINAQYPNLPNINYAGLGYNAFVGQPTLTALKYPVFSPFTYYNNQTVDIESNTFKVPDVLTCIDYPSETQKTVTQIYTSEILLQQSLYETYSYSFNPWFSMGMFSGSEQSSYFHQVNQKNAQYTATSTLEYTVYKIWYDEKNVLDTTFQKYLTMLPSTYNSTTCSYFKNFFNAFGTHFIFEAIFGGSVEAQTTFSISLLQSLTIEEIHEDIQTQFILSTQESLTYYEEEELTQLNAMYSSVFSLIGGNPSEFNVTQYQEWAATILSDPVIIGMELKNFTYFLNDTEKIDALNKAMISYFYSQYLDWNNINSAPYNIIYDRPNSIQIDNNVYFFGYPPFYRYNLIENLWYNLPSGPYASGDIESYSCTAVSTNIYCFGGYYWPTATYLNSANMYNAKTNTWSTIASMPYIMDVAITASVENYPYVYIFGGIASLGSSGVCDQWRNASPNLIYNTQTGTYSVIAAVPECLVDFSVHIVVDGIIYLFSAYECQSACTYSSSGGSSTCICTAVVSTSVWAYNTYNGVWTQLASMPVALRQFAVFVENNIIYTLGGHVKEEPSPYIYAYDIGENIWSTKSSNSHATQLSGFSAMYERLLFFFGCSQTSQECSVQMTALEEFC
jgi:N-acetylneuraminic acid mutarotase